jgi:hypothetical protein
MQMRGMPVLKAMEHCTSAVYVGAGRRANEPSSFQKPITPNLQRRALVFLHLQHGGQRLYQDGDDSHTMIAGKRFTKRQKPRLLSDLFPVSSAEFTACLVESHALLLIGTAAVWPTESDQAPKSSKEGKPPPSE